MIKPKTPEKTTDAFTITLPAEIFDKMESLIKVNYKTRSEYIKELVIADLRQEKLL